MKIIDLGLQFRENHAEGNVPRYMGMHHSGGIQTVQDYHQMHLNKGWAGLGYHFMVDTDGTIYKGRPVNYVPAGIENANQDSLQICAIGNFENMTMPDVQREAIKELIAYCKSSYGTISYLCGHKEKMATDCPGSNYPLQTMKDTFANGLIQVAPVVTPSPIQNKVFKLQHALNAIYITDENGNRLVEDGWIGDHTRAALRKVVVHRGDNNILVAWIQEQLGVAADNLYGQVPFHETYDAIVRWQQTHNLTVDATPGYNTITSML